MQLDLGQIQRDMDAQTKLFRYRPYGHPETLCPDGALWKADPNLEVWTNKPWQIEFHNAGAENPYRLLMAANGVGKTFPGGAEVAFHLTGLYPDWWEGRRFEHAPLIWVGSLTNESQREYTQKVLLGADLTLSMGTGFVPKRNIVGKPRLRQAGIPDVCDHFNVRHTSGDLSRCLFKTYEQGWRLWQSGAPDVIWMDEQHDEMASNERRIFAEVQTRLFRSRGIFLGTLTPLLGETEFIRFFTQPKAKGIYLVGATWDDAPHLDAEEKERLRNTYPEHEVEARTRGVPMMGEGRVFTVAEEQIRCQPFEIPPHYAQIAGIDFGLDHPFGYARIAWDRDADIIYLVDCFKVAGQESIQHAAAIRRRGDWVPIAWPHDGMNKEKGSGKQLYKYYAEQGVRMLPKSAHYVPNPGERPRLGAQPVEPIVMDVLERMKTGQFKAFVTCEPFFEEFRSYHRKDGKINPIRDDVLKAMFYAVMMKRHATTARPKTRPMPTRPIFSTGHAA